MKFSVAICTWNRADLLRQTLSALTKVKLPAGATWELLIVNNNCTDATDDVIDDFKTRLPLIRLFETKQGHCAARNCAIESADGEIIVWTDDDVEPDANWLVEYDRSIKDHPDASFWGGPIRPAFLAEKPDWVDENWDICGPCFALRELGDAEFEIDAKTLPYGANFAVRFETQKQFKFDTGLGRQGSIVTGEDEIDLLGRLLDAEHTGWWVPTAIVNHLIPAERMTEEYVYDYFVGQGRTLVAKNQHEQRSRISLGFETMIQKFLFRIKRPFAKSPAWMAHLARSALAHGQRSARSG